MNRKIFVMFLVLILFAGVSYAQCGGACGAGDNLDPTADDPGSSCDMKSGDACGGACAASNAPVPVEPASQKPSPKTDSSASLNVSALRALVISKTPMILLDARSGKNDDGKRIPGAQSLDENSTPEQIQALIPSKESLIVTYCANPKCQASPKLASHLKKQGYSNIMELPEGIQGWISAGYQVEEIKK